MAMATETVRRTGLFEEKNMTISQTTRKYAVETVITVGALLALAGVAHAQQVRELYSNTNFYGVNNGIYGQPTFSLGTATEITEVSTYHWNFGRGQMPGSISIRSTSGRSWGPFQARGSAGQGNAQNVNWTATVNIAVPAGTYMVFDSSPNTWSSNQQSGGRGFAKVYGFAISFVPGGGRPTPPALPPAPRPYTPVRPTYTPVRPAAPAYPFTPCAANSNPVAVVGPCVVPRFGILSVFEVRPGIVPARLQFLANTPYSTGYNVIVTLTPAGGSLYTMAVPPQLCGPGASTPGFKYNVFLLDSTGVRQGQIGQFTPDCR
jgi:hypothetical protein